MSWLPSCHANGGGHPYCWSCDYHRDVGNGSVLVNHFGKCSKQVSIIAGTKDVLEKQYLPKYCIAVVLNCNVHFAASKKDSAVLSNNGQSHGFLSELRCG